MTNETNEPTNEEIEVKILHLLSIYPIISHTMLQGALGPSLKAILWRPVLTRLIEEGKVEEQQESKMTPADRFNTYVKLMLPNTEIIHNAIDAKRG